MVSNKIRNFFRSATLLALLFGFFSIFGATEAMASNQLSFSPSPSSITLASTPQTVTYTVTANRPVKNLQTPVITTTVSSYATASVDGGSCAGATLLATQTCSFSVVLTQNTSNPGTAGDSFSLRIGISGDGVNSKELAPGVTVTSSGGSTLIVATPTFSPAAGTYSSAQTVTISSATSGATIYYTTDGTDPTTASTQYTSAIAVSSTQTVKAIAVKSGYVDSAIGSAAYTINLTYTVTSSAGSNGTISPSGAQTVNSGDNSPTFTATPALGYVVSGWTVDSSAYSACSTNTTCQLTNVTADHTIAVNFTLESPASLSVIEPSLMFVTTASSGVLTYQGMLTVKNTGSSTTGGVPIATLSTSSGFTQTATTCNATLALNATCTFTFTMTPPVVTSATVTVSDGVDVDGIVVVPTSAISVTAFSPPVNATNSASLMLVAGCSSTPEVLQVMNLSSATISSITGTASTANWTSSRNPTITNGCSSVSLGAYSSTNGADVCSLSVVPNVSAESADNGTITVSGTNTNTAGIIAAVEAPNAIPTTGGSAVTAGSALPGTSPTENVLSLNQTCNLVKVTANSNQSSNKQWDPLGSSAISTTGTSTAGNLGQLQSILAIHTVGFVENSGSGTAAANYAAGLCTPSQLNENNAVTWYLPSVGQERSTDPATMTSNGDELGLVLYYGVNSGNSSNTEFYWSSTELNTNSSRALFENFVGGSESQGTRPKDQTGLFVRCARALTY